MGLELIFDKAKILTVRKITMYYIKSIDKDIITIANSMEQRQISIEDLYSIKDVVVGFNRLTKQIKASEPESFFKYVLSYMKLTGNTEFSIECNLVEKIEHIENNKIKVTLSTDSVSYPECRNRFLIDYGKLFERIEKFIEDRHLPHTSVELVYDLIGINTELICTQYLFDAYEFGFQIDKVSFTDRADLSKYLKIIGLFGYYYPDEKDLFDDTFLVEGLTLDLSNLTLNRTTDLSNLLRGIIPRVIPPKFIGEAWQSIIDDVIITDSERFNSVVNIVKAYNNSKPTVRMAYFTMPLKLLEIKNSGVNFKWCLAKEVYLDCILADIPLINVSQGYTDDCILFIYIGEEYLEWLKNYSSYSVKALPEIINELEQIKNYTENPNKCKGLSIADIPAIQQLLHLRIGDGSDDLEVRFYIEADENNYTTLERVCLEKLLMKLPAYRISYDAESWVTIEWTGSAKTENH